MEIYENPVPGSLTKYTRFIKMKLNEIPTIVDHLMTFPNGMTCNAKSPRMRLLWLHKNLTCEFCGISASFAALESHAATPDATHLNFYATDYAGKEILLTWDHVQPKSLGGSNAMNNSQCLCTICNGLKGNDKSEKEVKQARQKLGMPIRYEYFGDGSMKFFWTRKQFSTNLPGEAQSKLTGESIN